MKIPILIAILFLLFSCHKDKLVGESSVLVGDWQWSYSEKVNFQGDNYVNTEDTLASSFQNSYGLIIQENGILKTTINDQIDKRYRIVIDYNVGNVSAIRLNNREKNRFAIQYLNDTLLKVTELHFPLIDKDVGYDNYYYSHYLIRK